MEDRCKQVSGELNGKKPGENVTQFGTLMVYGLTIPKNSENRTVAMKFVVYVMTKGLKLLADMGQPSAVPETCSTYQKFPNPLMQFAKRPNR